MTTSAFRMLGCLLFLSVCVHAQEHAALPQDANRQKQLLEAITARYNKDVSQLAGPNKKYIAEVYKDRCEMIKNDITNDEIITDVQSTSYLNALAGEVLKANPALNGTELRIVFSRSWAANACSMGEGTIFFNIGLFHRLENESQAIFALCHEMAHYYLDHGNKGIEKIVNTLFSDEFQKKLKSIQKSEFRQNQQLDEMGKTFTFRTRRHSREFEEAADSLALQFMKGTGYDLKGALTCLALLDTSEQEKYSGPIYLDKRFEFTAFHFKKEWCRSDGLLFSSATESSEEADSLKTHPDCKKRIEKLRPWVMEFNKGTRNNFLVSESRFQELKQRFDYEILAYTYENNVSKCLYLSLKMLNAQPDNAYLHILVAKCLNEIYEKQKAHELNRIVELPDPGNKEDYNQLLNMIQNLRLSEVASLSYYYLREHGPVCEKDKEFEKTMKTSTDNFLK